MYSHNCTTQHTNRLYKDYNVNWVCVRMEGLGWAQASGDVALEGLGTEAGDTASSACACEGPGMGAGDAASSACTCACGRLETS
jgi:hypothetical protein